MQYKIRRTLLNDRLVYVIENLETKTKVDLFYVEYGKDVPIIEKALFNTIVEEFKSCYGDNDKIYDKRNFHTRLTIFLGLSLENDSQDPGAKLIKTCTFNPIRLFYINLRYKEFDQALYIIKKTISKPALDTYFSKIINRDVDDLSDLAKEEFAKVCEKFPNVKPQELFRDIALLVSIREYNEGLANCNTTSSLIKEMDSILTSENL